MIRFADRRWADHALLSSTTPRGIFITDSTVAAIMAPHVGGAPAADTSVMRLQKRAEHPPILGLKKLLRIDNGQCCFELQG